MSTAFVLSPGMLDSFDDLIAVLPEPVHFYDLLRRMLQIAVDDYAAVSGRIEKTGIYGGFLAKVSGKINAFNTGIMFCFALNLHPGIVCGTVVDKYKFIRYPVIFQNPGYGL